MDFDDFLGPKPIVVDLRAKDRWDAIDELVGHLVGPVPGHSGSR